MAVDTFDRPATGIGLTLGSTPLGQQWRDDRGVGGISNGEVYASSLGSGSLSAATIDTIVADGTIESVMSSSLLPTSAGGGIVFRLQDASNYRFAFCYRTGAGGYSVFSGRMQAGTATYDHLNNVSVSNFTGQTLTVIFAADQITVRLNGATIGSSYTSSFGQTATRHGVYALGGSSVSSLFRYPQPLRESSYAAVSY